MCPPAVPDRTLQTFPPERHTNLVRRRGGLISVPGRLWKAPETRPGYSQHRLTKLLLNVTIERSLGPVQVVMSPENTVNDLIKSAVDIYVEEKRRPLVKDTDPHRFELHYSQFSLESLKADEKLIKLGSRNFFLCSNSSGSAAVSSNSGRTPSNCSEDAREKLNSPLPLIMLMDFLL
ncbi:uncharacterized protein LOC126795976 [Argentina anserina]|uniref:uncharacterized protein LOC126795976 n=1 Tax=Argentina anserina TaxID=57926 RepID=UPI002176462A|nr:uncharacterized protein LOC126795976 [Potentilla anserina]